MEPKLKCSQTNEKQSSPVDGCCLEPWCVWILFSYGHRIFRGENSPCLLLPIYTFKVAHKKQRELVVWDEKQALTKESLSCWVRAVLQGTAKSWRRSKMPPIVNDGPIKIVVGRTFDSIVLDPSVDVLLALVSPRKFSFQATLDLNCLSYPQTLCTNSDGVPTISITSESLFRGWGCFSKCGGSCNCSNRALRKRFTRLGSPIRLWNTLTSSLQSFRQAQSLASRTRRPKCARHRRFCAAKQC